jgi:hypothetical protein
MLRGHKLVGALVLWMTFIGGGFYAMGNYENTPGAQLQAPQNWPRDTPLHLATHGSTLLVFLHPGCSCSVATLLEVRRLLEASGGRIQVTALFISPERAGPGLQGPIADQAAAIPGITLAEDRGGVEARRFRALTSGFALLYSPAGRLEFAGGLTRARGLAGNNRGAQFFLQAALGTRTGGTSRVFGCGLGGLVLR